MKLEYGALRLPGHIRLEGVALKLPGHIGLEGVALKLPRHIYHDGAAALKEMSLCTLNKLEGVALKLLEVILIMMVRR